MTINNNDGGDDDDDNDDDDNDNNSFYLSCPTLDFFLIWTTNNIFKINK